MEYSRQNVAAPGIVPAVKLSPEDEAELLQALDEADVEDGISADELFARLQRFC